MKGRWGSYTYIIQRSILQLHTCTQFRQLCIRFADALLVNVYCRFWMCCPGHQVYVSEWLLLLQTQQSIFWIRCFTIVYASIRSSIHLFVIATEVNGISFNFFFEIPYHEIWWCGTILFIKNDNYFSIDRAVYMVSELFSALCPHKNKLIKINRTRELEAARKRWEE